LQELAKYYEHKAKDYKQALEYCDKALGLIENNFYSPNKEKLTAAKKVKFSDDFLKRKKRLNRKLEL
jgi:dihydroorotate dehydrogenase